MAGWPGSRPTWSTRRRLRSPLSHGRSGSSRWATSLWRSGTNPTAAPRSAVCSVRRPGCSAPCPRRRTRRSRRAAPSSGCGCDRACSVVSSGCLPTSCSIRTSREATSGVTFARVEDLLGEAATPRAALDELQSFVAHRTDEPDPLVDEAVRHLMPWHGSGPASLPALLSISERQLRRRCRAAVGVGPKELHRILRCRASSPASGRRSTGRAPGRRSRPLGRRGRVPRPGTPRRECRRSWV